MYLRITERRNRDGSTVAYYALAENTWNAAAKRAEARVVHNFGRADEVDHDGLRRLIKSINRVLEAGDVGHGKDSPQNLTHEPGTGGFPRIFRRSIWRNR